MQIMNRPLFNTAWMRFQEINVNTEKVGAKIGGNVGLNIASGAFSHVPAVRLSFVLNRSGVRIPRIANQTISGADGSWYFTRVRDLRNYLQRRLGPADVHSLPARASNLQRRRGLLLFDLPGWTDNGGHATLWNGVHAADASDFSQTRDMLLWALP